VPRIFQCSADVTGNIARADDWNFQSVSVLYERKYLYLFKHKIVAVVFLVGSVLMRFKTKFT
jgi:hypothetical protein